MAFYLMFLGKMFLSPHLNISGKAMELFFGDTGFKSHLGKLLPSSDHQCLHPKIVVRIIKLMYSKILTPYHRVDGLMCMSFRVCPSDSDKSTKTYWQKTHSYSFLQLTKSAQ